MRVIGVIPARYESSRLAGKPLADIHGKPMIQHVYEAAQGSQLLSEVIVATDDERIAQAVKAFQGQVVMTRVDHACGTERVAEVVERLDADLVVNIQGDEPLLPPILIDECVQALQKATDVGIATVMKRIPDEQFEDPAVVKVVTDRRGRALYFSRSLLPYPRTRTKEFAVFEHVGLYAYRRDALLSFSKLPPTTLEQIEGLEQLRALENGIGIQVVETSFQGDLISVDTPDDLQRVRAIVASRS